jgi:hypothetical protein
MLKQQKQNKDKFVINEILKGILVSIVFSLST